MKATGAYSYSRAKAFGIALLIALSSGQVKSESEPTAGSGSDDRSQYLEIIKAGALDAFREIYKSLPNDVQQQVKAKNFQIGVGWIGATGTRCHKLGNLANASRTDSAVVIWLCEDALTLVAQSVTSGFLLLWSDHRIMKAVLGEIDMKNAMGALAEGLKKQEQVVMDYYAKKYVEAYYSRIANRNFPGPCMPQEIAFLVATGRDPTSCSVQNPVSGQLDSANVWASNVLSTGLRLFGETAGLPERAKNAPPFGIESLYGYSIEGIIRYLLLHEIGHFMLVDKSLPQRSTAQEKLNIEIAADRFALTDRSQNATMNQASLRSLVQFWRALGRADVGSLPASDEEFSMRALSLFNAQCQSGLVESLDATDPRRAVLLRLNAFGCISN